MYHSSCQRFLIPSTAPASISVWSIVLQSGDKRQEAGSETHPQLHDNDDRQYIIFILQPLDRLQNDAEPHQKSVQIPIAVPGKDDQPDEEHIAGDRRAHRRPAS